MIAGSWTTDHVAGVDAVNPVGKFVGCSVGVAMMIFEEKFQTKIIDRYEKYEKRNKSLLDKEQAKNRKKNDKKK